MISKNTKSSGSESRQPCLAPAHPRFAALRIVFRNAPSPGMTGWAPPVQAVTLTGSPIQVQEVDHTSMQLTAYCPNFTQGSDCSDPDVDKHCEQAKHKPK